MTQRAQATQPGTAELRFEPEFSNITRALPPSLIRSQSHKKARAHDSHFQVATCYRNTLVTETIRFNNSSSNISTKLETGTTVGQTSISSQPFLEVTILRG